MRLQVQKWRTRPFDAVVCVCFWFWCVCMCVCVSCSHYISRTCYFSSQRLRHATQGPWNSGVLSASSQPPKKEGRLLQKAEVLKRLQIIPEYLQLNKLLFFVPSIISESFWKPPKMEIIGSECRCHFFSFILKPAKQLLRVSSAKRTLALQGTRSTQPHQALEMSL